MSAVPGAEAPGIDDAGGRRWSFAAVEFDERSLELRVSGQPVELEPKAIEVLRQLLYRAGEVVTKDELLEAVWPGRVLSDNSLPKSVSRIREVIGDADQAIIKTVHGYGYRLVAPVKVQRSAAAPTLTRLDLNAGDHPPLRPLWSLVDKLGSGGQGEVWRVRHDKTGEQRVFKFALDVAGLAAIKREITLYRFLRQTLEGRDEFTRVLDWNLEEAPYYVELEYGAGGNLEAWAEAAGGLSQVALPVRLEIIASIAEPLAAAHSVGVLHKDLKPSNVLVVSSPLPATRGEVGAQSAPGEGPVRIKLTDFGSGGVLDPKRLEALGITRLGFTQSIMVGEAAATAMYLAPEVMAGQPATVQADVYSLGILLWQAVIGDFRQPLFAGWEQRVDDALLVEDIALAVAGDPARRLSDAGALATRLRTLDARRAQRAAEQAERERLEHEKREAGERARLAELELMRLRTRRQWMLTVVSVLVVATSFSLGLYLDARRARNEAAAAAASSQAVADFLSNDMFAQVGTRPLRELSVRELLHAASTTLPDRRELMPEAAAQIHGALGKAFWTMEMADEAAKHLEQALTLEQRTQGSGAETSLQMAAQLILAKGQNGSLEGDLSRYEQLLAAGRSSLGDAHAAVLMLSHNLAHARLVQGHWRRAADDFATVLERARSIPEPNEGFVASAAMLLGFALTRAAAFDDALQVLRESAQRSTAALGSQHPLVAKTKMFLGQVLLELDQLQAADRELTEALEIVRPWAIGDSSAHILAIEAVRARLEVRRNNSGAAIPMLEQVVNAATAMEWNKHRDHTAEFRQWLGEAYLANGRLRDAAAATRAALASSEGSYGSRHPLSQGIRLRLAEILVRQRQVSEARAVIERVDPAALSGLPADHPLQAERQRVNGLIAAAERRPTEARRELDAALRIFEARFPAGHSLILRARAERTQYAPP